MNGPAFYLPRQRGFAYIAAVVLLLVVAGISVALLRLTSTQQSTVNQGLLAARANQAARAGVEWAMYRIVNASPTGCPAATTLNDFRADSGFRVSVTCTATAFNEGESAPGAAVAKRIYQIDAVACNSPGAQCPDTTTASVSAPDYVERRRSASICLAADGQDCY